MFHDQAIQRTTVRGPHLTYVCSVRILPFKKIIRDAGNLRTGPHFTGPQSAVRILPIPNPTDEYVEIIETK